MRREPKFAFTRLRVRSACSCLANSFCSYALAPPKPVSVLELVKIAGTSVRMIEKHYGALLDGAQAGSQAD